MNEGFTERSFLLTAISLRLLQIPLAQLPHRHGPFADAYRYFTRGAVADPDENGISRTQIGELHGLPVIIRVAGFLVHLENFGDLRRLLQKQLFLCHIHRGNNEKLLPTLCAGESLVGLGCRRKQAEGFVVTLDAMDIRVAQLGCQPASGRRCPGN